jgi:hydroxypyruvate reductase
MSNLTQLRIAAREIFDEALRAVDAGDAVRRAIQFSETSLRICNLEIDIANRKIYAIAIGKASSSMASALEDRISERLAEGLIVGPIANHPQGRNLSMATPKLWRWCDGGHPLPTESSLSAANEAFALLERANAERALVIFLISGGGSAMIESPISEEISLGDLREANQILINCGASIGEINSVRRAFSAVKGGRLSARAPDCDQITLIVSDVPEGEERNVASGPTLAPPRDAPNPLDVLAQYNLRTQLPETILRAMEKELSEPVDDVESQFRKHFVLLNNDTALKAAAESARKRGFIAEIAEDISDQPIREGCEKLRKSLEALRAKHRNEAGIVCLVSGGEFACPVSGNGIGGRNLETGLRLAVSESSDVADTVALCAGTDGIDGNSPAAGAIIDNTTMARARSIGLDANDFLERSDSYSFFVALGDVINTGVTGTNVRDLRILLARTSESAEN